MKIRGGISYFLWDREHDGPCEVHDDLGRRADRPGRCALPRCVRHPRPAQRGGSDPGEGAEPKNGADARCSRVAASQAVRPPHQSSMASQSAKGMKNPVKLFGSQKVSWVERVGDSAQRRLDRQVEGASLAEPLQGHGGQRRRTRRVFSTPIHRRARARPAPRPISSPVRSTPRTEAESVAVVPAHSVRPLPRLASQDHAAHRHASVYAFVPDCRLDRDLDGRRALHEVRHRPTDEIAFIESDDPPDGRRAERLTMSKPIEEILAPKPEARPRIYAYSIDDEAHDGSPQGRPDHARREAARRRAAQDRRHQELHDRAGRVRRARRRHDLHRPRGARGARQEGLRERRTGVDALHGHGREDRAHRAAHRPDSSPARITRRSRCAASRPRP